MELGILNLIIDYFQLINCTLYSTKIICHELSNYANTFRYNYFISFKLFALKMANKMAISGNSQLESLTLSSLSLCFLLILYILWRDPRTPNLSYVPLFTASTANSILFLFNIRWTI